MAASWSNATRAAKLSLEDFDDEAHPYVYAHTLQKAKKLESDLQQLIAASPAMAQELSLKRVMLSAGGAERSVRVAAL